MRSRITPNTNTFYAVCSCTAALYKIEFANREGFADPSRTEELCEWNKNLREIKPVKIKDMDTQEHNREKQNKQYVINNNIKNTLTQELKVIVM